MAGREGEIVINLRRNNLNTPWGFRLQGGKEYGTYLSVQRVFNGSPSDGHLQRGDILVAVNNEDVTQWLQNEAQNLIQSIGLTLGLVVMRGGAVPYAEARQPTQIQSVPSFARKPFGQQQQQQEYASHPPPPPPSQHQPLSPQMTSKATLQFQPSSWAPSQPSNEFETNRPSPTVTWTPQAPKTPDSSFSAPLQVRIGQPPAKPYSFSPQQGDSRAYQPPPGVGQANYQQDYVGGGGGGAPYEREAHPRVAAQSTQQPSYGGGGSNHVTHDRNQSHEGFGYDDRNEQAFYEGRREGGVGGGGGGGEGEEEGEDYQQMSVRDIKQMFNKPDQKGSRATSRVKQPQKLWTRPPGEGSLSPGAYGAPGPMPGQPSSLSSRKPTTGSIRRGPPPSDDDYPKPLSPQPHHQSYSHQPRYDSAGPGYGAKEQKSSTTINKQGGAYAGIIQPTLPAKAPPAKSAQKGAQKKEFDPNQSAVYKILLEEEERRKNNPNQRDEEEEQDEAPRRPTQGPAARQGGQPPRQQAQAPKQAQGSRLTELLERDAAQIAPYKEKPKSSYQEHVTPYHHEQKPSYQEPPRASYQQEPQQQLYRGPPSHGAPVARQSQPSHYGGGGGGGGGGAGGGHDYHQVAFPQTQYVDGIPTSDF